MARIDSEDESPSEPNGKSEDAKVTAAERVNEFKKADTKQSKATHVTPRCKMSARRWELCLVAAIGTIFGASVTLGYITLFVGPGHIGLMLRGAYMESNSVEEGSYYHTAGEAASNQQRLLELAERIVTACSETSLNLNDAECQNLCKPGICCFGSGEGVQSCENDIEKNCAVYGGCDALF